MKLLIEFTTDYGDFTPGDRVVVDRAALLASDISIVDDVRMLGTREDAGPYDDISDDLLPADDEGSEA